MNKQEITEIYEIYDRVETALVFLQHQKYFNSEQILKEAMEILKVLDEQWEKKKMSIWNLDTQMKR